MHGWFQIFPPTEFWSRAPSGLAVGGAAAGVVVLGRQFSSRTVALASGVFCAILPRTTWAGIEARPYALSMMAAVWLTVLLVAAARRNTAWSWLSYGIALAISIMLDAYLVLLVLAHLDLRLCLPAHAKSPGPLRHYVGGGGVRPGAVLGRRSPGKRIRSAGSHRSGTGRSKMCVVQQYFERSPPFAILSALVVAAAIVLWLCRSARLAHGRSTTADHGGRVAGDTDRRDRDLVGAGSPDLHAALFVPSPHRRWR